MSSHFDPNFEITIRPPKKEEQIPGSALPELGLYVSMENDNCLFALDEDPLTETKAWRREISRGEVILLTEVEWAPDLGTNTNIHYKALYGEKVMEAYWRLDMFHKGYKKVVIP